MKSQDKSQKKLLALLRRHSPAIEEICRDWWKFETNFSTGVKCGGGRGRSQKI